MTPQIRLAVAVRVLALLGARAVAGRGQQQGARGAGRRDWTRASDARERSNQSLVELQQQIERAAGAAHAARPDRGSAARPRDDRQQQRDLYADLDRRLLLIENAGGTAAARRPSGPPTAPEVVFADETAVYGDAFAAMKAGRYDEAVNGFQLYLTKYPRGPARRQRHVLARRGAIRAAGLPRRRSSRSRPCAAFPDSRKLPDALLKVGYCQYELKAFKNARATLQKLIATYPDTDAARLRPRRASPR